MTRQPCPHPRNVVILSEKISRFIFEKAHLKSKNQAVFKAPASLRFSVYRMTKVSDDEIWETCRDYVENLRGMPAVGRVDLQAEEYALQGLGFDPNGKPHTRHTDVVGWKTHKPDDLEKRMALALAGKWIPKK